jgi:hypothetical protein
MIISNITLPKYSIDICSACNLLIVNYTIHVTVSIDERFKKGTNSFASAIPSNPILKLLANLSWLAP